MNDREAILGRINAALRGGQAASAEQQAQCERYVEAHPAGPLPRAGWAARARFEERARALASTFDAVATSGDAPAAVARYLAANGLPGQAVCWPALAALPWSAHGLSVETRPARGDDLVGITSAFSAIADTGTLMLLGAPETPAATSLLPETHVVVLPASRIVPFMEDAWTAARRELKGLPRAVNFVSGPSRTADIEQTVYLGAHGPYRVHIVLVENE